MGNARYLTYRQEADLVEWVAARGQNYQQYLQFCDHYDVKQRYTEYYFKRWCDKKRPRLKMKREEAERPPQGERDLATRLSPRWCGHRVSGR